MSAKSHLYETQKGTFLSDARSANEDSNEKKSLLDKNTKFPSAGREFTTNRKGGEVRLVSMEDNQTRYAVVNKNGDITKILYEEQDNLFIKYARLSSAQQILFHGEHTKKRSKTLYIDAHNNPDITPNGKLVYTDQDGKVKEQAVHKYKYEFKSMHRTCRCLKFSSNYLQGKNEGVDVRKNIETNKAYYGNLTVCGSVWTCPVCASKISEHRRNELSLIFNEHLGIEYDENGENGKRVRNLDNGVFFLTLTVPHNKYTDLSLLMAQIRDANKFMTQHRQYKKLMKEIGCIGQVKALEVTYSDKNGWHPHYHILIFVDKHEEIFSGNSDKNGKQKHSAYGKHIKDAICDLWDRACIEADFAKRIDKKAQDLRDGSYAKEYISKFGIEHELTKWHLKQGNKSLTPFQMLDVYLTSEDDEEVRKVAGLFNEYAKCFKGYHQLRWTPGLKARFQIEDSSDEEIAETIDETDPLIAHVTLSQWKIVLKSIHKHGFIKYKKDVDARSELLWRALSGGQESVDRYIADLETQHAIKKIVERDGTLFEGEKPKTDTYNPFGD